ncbi:MULTISPECIES: type II toxin-antitoxin system VapC family toxin [unclassified Pseudofrankia]|uniref:type II toxin-antitoxin system VapC family toxin n=1 Tax=unclassified Pseudofrankia TaxID=2994372 RepID=UPI0008D8FFC5|nr:MULTISPECIES: type II toxin-antitoxin system VapC family toxin [unclassified Pseudofrankia]MDT3443868.1 type II toxin-antitoxin system VapC family toxin [Pseudofrankia sp. BMG5.37]OHV60865.1 twitching motility protein PilT [Pseudofrankia sp. BMG5.36]
MSFLLDTNVISELRKPAKRRDDRFNAWAETLSPSDTFLSVITLLELRAGIENKRRQDAHQAAVLDTWLDQHVLPAYAGRLLDVDPAVADAAARLHVPDRRPAHDALIAATAVVHGLRLVTRNESDFAPMGIPLVNPWAPQS